MKKIHFLCLLSALLLYGTSTLAQGNDTNFVKGKIYFKIKDSSPVRDYNYSGGRTEGLPQQLTELIKTFGVTEIKRPFLLAKSPKLDRIFSVSFTETREIQRLMSVVASLPGIEYAEPVPVDRLFCTGDPITWSSSANDYHLNLVQACSAWGFPAGATVNVAILDNECDVNHPDLAGKVTSYYDIADSDPNVLGPSTLNHGTHVTGIVGAIGNNGGIVGLGGMNPNVKLIFGKIAQDASGALTDGYTGMVWAVAQGADVINCSWGSAEFFSMTNSLVTAWVISQGVIIVAASGNNNINAPAFPASFPGVYSVAASDQSDNKASFSNWGPTVDISAPGVAIYSTISSAVGAGPYDYMSGTSMASPMVAALAGLIKSNNPGYTAAQVLNCISSTTDPVISAQPVGPGRINALQALKCSSGSSDYVQFKISKERLCPGDQVSFSDISITSSAITNWDWTISSMTNTLTASGPNPTVSFPDPGIYHAVLTVTCASSQTFTSYYPTDIHVVGINAANFSSTGNFCKNGDAMISIEMDAWPELIMDYDINGVSAPTMTVLNQYNGIYDLVLTTPNAPVMNVQIMKVSDGILSCPSSLAMSAPLVDCCANLVPNGGFEAGSVGFGTDLSLCSSLIAPGYATTRVWAFAPYVPQRGAIYYHTDGTSGAYSGYTLCPSTPPVPPAGMGSSHYNNSFNLIAGSDYILSFVFNGPNQQYVSMAYPGVYIFPPSIFRVSLLDPSAASVFTQTWTPNPTTVNKWIQFKEDLSGMISTTGSYTLNVEQIINFDGMAFDYNWDDFSVTAINTLTSSITPSLTALCSAGNAPMTVSSGNAKPTATYAWTSSPSGSYPTTASINPSVSATTVYTATITDGNFCQVKATATVTVGSQTIAVSSQTICGGSSATLTASGAGSYTWQPGGLTGNPVVVTPTATTVYTVTGTISAGCVASATASVTYSNCPTICSNCTVLGAGGTINAGTYSGTVYCINNNVTISGAVNISNCELKMSPNVVVTIVSGGFLNATNTHIYSCSDMWRGIVIRNGGRLSLRNCLTEDAITAVDISNNTQTSAVLTVLSSAFNRNYKSIVISNYNQPIATFPFNIRSSVFTCRAIAFTPNSLVFPSAATIGAAATNPGAPLTNPYIPNSTYPETSAGAYLKAPFAGLKSNVGIELNKVGSTTNPQSTSPTYYEFSIGDNGGKNIFDNQSYGINASNSNLSSFNNVFQNSIATAGSSDGIGINCDVNDVNNYRLRVTSATAATPTEGNQFVDCSRDINTTSVFEHQITYNDFRSSQVNSAPATFVNARGNYGVKSVTNRFRLYNVSNNTMYNLENAVMMDAIAGPLNIPGVAASGQYAGKVDIDNNIISAMVGAMPTTQYVSNAITLNTIIGAPVISSTPFPNVPVIRASNNSILNVYRAINYNNWTKVNSLISFNEILLVSDPYNASGPPVQFGISLTNAQPSTGTNSISSNVVTGYTPTYTNLYGIVTAKSLKTTVNCNLVRNTYSGIEFQGNCSGTVFTNNGMDNHTYGFVLRNSASIGVQGSTTVPTDNSWTGSWPAGTYKTATINSSASSNELWVRSSAGPVYDPNGSGFTNMTYGSDDYFAPVTLRYVSTKPAFVQCPSNPGNVIPPSFRMAKSEEEQGSAADPGFDVVIYPNPGSSDFNLSLPGLDETEVMISISDMTGKLVYEHRHRVAQALTRFEIDVANGIYMVKIADANTQRFLVKKLVVQK